LVIEGVTDEIKSFEEEEKLLKRMYKKRKRAILILFRSQMSLKTLLINLLL
jgi:hypothetical protein